MKFCELLEQYIDTLHCSYKELSDLSGISPSVISRYKTGEREPSLNSVTLSSLARALATIAKEKQIEDMSEESILSSFSEVLLSNTLDYSAFIDRFNTLYNEMDLNMKRISSYTQYDISFLYRIKNGERKVADPILFSKK